MNEQDAQNNFSVNFSVPELINPKDTFSCKKELTNEWNDIVDKIFPENLEGEFEKEKLMNVAINEINWDGETFEFKMENEKLNEEDKVMIAYILSKAVQKEHNLDEKKIDIEIVSGNHKKYVNF